MAYVSLIRHSRALHSNNFCAPYVGYTWNDSACDDLNDFFAFYVEFLKRRLVCTHYFWRNPHRLFEPHVERLAYRSRWDWLYLRTSRSSSVYVTSAFLYHLRLTLITLCHFRVILFGIASFAPYFIEIYVTCAIFYYGRYHLRLIFQAEVALSSLAVNELFARIAFK